MSCEGGKTTSGHQLLRLRLSAHVENARTRRRAGAALRVQRLMHTHRIQGEKRRGKPWRTTKLDPGAQRPPDLVQRNFSASRPNELGSPTSPACAAGKASSSSPLSSTPS